MELKTKNYLAVNKLIKLKTKYEFRKQKIYFQLKCVYFCIQKYVIHTKIKQVGRKSVSQDQVRANIHIIPGNTGNKLLFTI